MLKYTDLRTFKKKRVESQRWSWCTYENINKWFNDFGFRARGKRDGNGQTPMRVFDPCTWNRHGYRIQDLGKRKDLGHPRLEFYHLEKLETKESRAPTRASERVAIRVAIEESLR